MLKLTNSFCRFLNLAYDLNHNKIYMKRFSLLSYKRKTANSIQISYSPAFIEFGQQQRLLANIKKRLPSKSNDSKKNNQMSDSLQPTINHSSYGGQFEIAADDASMVLDWNKLFNGPGSSNHTEKETRPIPSNFRTWEPVLKKSENNGATLKFKVVSYNLLAQYLLECHPYLYTDCCPRNLKWKVRASKLFDEIVKLSPDILCFQEVQASHLDSFYAKFERIGYFGVFKQKTGHRQDGCAIYFKRSLFKMEDYVSVEFYQPGLSVLNRDNIGIIVKLLPKNFPGSSIVVSTTHLLYNPKRTDVRLAQMQVLLAELDRFAYYNNGRESGHLPIILTGDFNSTPESAVIKLLDGGQISASSFRNSSDLKRIGVTDNCQHLSVYLNRQQGLSTDFSMTKIYNSEYSASEPEPDYSSETADEYSPLFDSGFIGHSLKLVSAYNKYKENGNNEATTFQDNWVTVDYIYFSCCSTLRLVDRLRLPTATECDVLGRLPNDVYGSDHLVLAAVFELLTCKSSL